ncbi:MAG: L-histidine N(alpha)-methyltransferase [Pseudomonadota bacterium]
MSESNNNFRFYDFHPPENDFKKDVLEGLHSNLRSIPPKYFYDERGSKLFEQITSLEEYYPTRCELEIFETYSQDIARSIGDRCVLIEPGSGNGDKARILLKLLKPSIFIPIDISKQHLKIAAQNIANEFSGLNVSAVCCDFSLQLKLPNQLPSDKRVIFFPGSSIGNFDPHEAIKYLENLALVAGENGQLLIGVDLKKDKTTLQMAYDDRKGITAKFNLNLIMRMNRELGADFDMDAWRHRALYNDIDGRIEMHLTSQSEQLIKIDDSEFFFDKDEFIHTENSYKYYIEEFQELANQAGFHSQNVWLDQNKLFSVHLFVCK